MFTNLTKFSFSFVLNKMVLARKIVHSLENKRSTTSSELNGHKNYTSHHQRHQSENYCKNWFSDRPTHSLPDMTWRHTAQCAARSLFCTNCMAVFTFWTIMTIGKSVYVVFNNVHYYLYSLTWYISCEWWNIGIKVKLTDNNFEKGRNSTNFHSSSLRWSRKIWPISFMHVNTFL